MGKSFDEYLKSLYTSAIENCGVEPNLLGEDDTKEIEQLREQASELMKNQIEEAISKSILGFDKAVSGGDFTSCTVASNTNDDSVFTEEKLNELIETVKESDRERKDLSERMALLGDFSSFPIKTDLSQIRGGKGTNFSKSIDWRLRGFPVMNDFTYIKKEIKRHKKRRINKKLNKKYGIKYINVKVRKLPWVYLNCCN